MLEQRYKNIIENNKEDEKNIHFEVEVFEDKNINVAINELNKYLNKYNDYIIDFDLKHTQDKNGTHILIAKFLTNIW